MPITWPWSRSRSVAEEPPSGRADSAGFSGPVDPGWRAVPPVQRTIGAMGLTAPPRDFTSSLATAQDPALISGNRPTLLTTGAPVSVLRMTEQHPDPVAVQTKSRSAAPSSRQWMPPLDVQRAALGGNESSPPAIHPLMSSEAVEPYGEVATPSSSFVEANDPDEPRVVPVVDHAEISLPPPAVTGGPREPTLQRAVEPMTPAPSARSDSAAASVQPIVESADHVGPAPSAVQRSSAGDAVPQAPVTSDPLRAVPVVEFSPPGQDSTNSVADMALGVPSVTDTVTGSTPQAQSTPAPHVAKPVGTKPISSSVQRSAIDDAAIPTNGPAADIPTAGTTDTSWTAPLVEHSRPESSSSHTDPGVTVGAVSGSSSIPTAATANTHSGAQALQRNFVSDDDGVRPAVRPLDTPPETSQLAQRAVGSAGNESVVDVPRPVVAESLAPRVGDPTRPEPPVDGPMISAVQRSVVGGPAEPASGSRPTSVPVFDDGVRTALTSSTAGSEFPRAASQTGSGLPVEVQRSTVRGELVETAHHTVTAPTTQANMGQSHFGSRRTAKVFDSPMAHSDTPVAQRTTSSGNSAPDSVMAAQFGMGMTTSSRPVNDLPPSGRIVLLPPVRTVAREPASQARDVLADSGRPMSLQRMFGDFAETAPHQEVGTPRSSGAQATVQTAAFDAPTAQPTAHPEPEPIPFVQGISEDAPAASGTPGAGSASAAAHAPAQAPADVDELVGRLYEPLAARLRAELWLDRERAGALMGLHR